MATKHFCAHCDLEFVPEEAGDKPRCPECMRRSGVQAVPAVPSKEAGRRPWLVAGVLLLVAAGVGYGVYRSTVITLEDTPPLRPLQARELSAYLERDQVEVGKLGAMLVLPDDVGDWPESTADVATRMHRESSTWSLDHPLPREVLTVDETLAALGAKDERVRLYPIEAAAAMTALLREQGVRAMVAEVWAFETEQTPLDPSGMFGYFLTAIYDGDSDEPTAFFDAWGGRGEVSPSSVRVLRDSEVVAAALGTDAMRIFVKSGNAAEALPMVETALLLDPLSPSLRGVNATILVEMGGLDPAVKEFEAALQLRPDGPRQLNLAQLHLAQAGMLEISGESAAAEAQFGTANRLTGEVIEKWPRYARAHLALAMIHLGVQEPERARVELEIAQGLDPDAAMLWALWAQYHLAEQNPIAAAAKMKRAIELHPDNWQLRLQAARVLQVAGDNEAARANVERALQLVPAAKRNELRQYIARSMGPSMLDDEPALDIADDDLALPDPSVVTTAEPMPGAPGDPALKLGDPSDLRLRDPDQTLRLDLDE